MSDEAQEAATARHGAGEVTTGREEDRDKETEGRGGKSVDFGLRRPGGGPV